MTSTEWKTSPKSRVGYDHGSCTGVDAAPLLAMQNEYDMQMAERNETFMENSSIFVA